MIKKGKRIKTMTLNELSTKIRGYAYECGGGHHTQKEIEKTLLEYADAIDETVFNITNVSKVGTQTIQELTGMDNRYYDLCRKHIRDKELNNE